MAIGIPHEAETTMTRRAKSRKAAKGSKSKESKRSEEEARKPVRFHYSAINKEGVRVKEP